MSQDDEHGTGTIVKTFVIPHPPPKDHQAKAKDNGDDDAIIQTHTLLRLSCVSELSLSDGFLLIEEDFQDLTGLQVCMKHI